MCVWPRLAAFARGRLPPGIRVAAVADFPAGSGEVERALADVTTIAAAGAQEVDLVLPWQRLMAGDEAACVAVLQAVRRESAGLTLKVILETGELKTRALVERAARLAIEAGADFIKTGTGKVPVGATLQAAGWMLGVIVADAYARQRVGFKAAGGVRTVADAAAYLSLAEHLLGPAMLVPQRFRFGASGLLEDIEAVLSGRVPGPGAAGY